MVMRFLLAVVFCLISFSGSSTHFMGGEITWTCLKAGPNAGQYIFRMKVYRDCGGTTFSQTAQTLTAHNYPLPGSTTPILLNFVSITDISPVGSPGSGNACFDCATQPFGTTGAVEEYIWESDPTTLVGTPPAEGWHFTWGTCCRSSNISNGMADQDWTLRAVMYPYTDPVTGNVVPADPCFDSSPEFKELAKTIICTGYPFAYSHNASDEELDELTYSWGEPLGNAFAYSPSNPSATALTFSAPYTLNSPIPGNPTLDIETGEIAYNSATSGVFVTCVKVEARKCGQLIAEIYREVQVVLLDCTVYNPPQDGFNDPPVISPAFTDPVTGLPSYETTVYAGDLVNFTIDAEDLDVYNYGSLQNITLDVSGGQFASDYININSCANPPCATFNNGAGVTPPFSAPGFVSGVFEWQTDCAHMEADVGCSVTSNVFTFSVKAYDDFCPANGISIATIKITVVPPIPDLRCVSVQDNGDVLLTWKFVSGAPPTLEPYMVYYSNNRNGPYTLIDSAFYPETTYLHQGANANQESGYYFLSTEESCGVLSSTLESDTLQSIFMDVSPINLGVSANLNWNAIHDPLLPTSFLDYTLYIRNDTSSVFVNTLTTPLLTYQYDAEFCEYYPEFYVEIEDVSGCVSKSSIGDVMLLDSITPITPVIADVSVNVDGKSVITWTSSPGADFYAIYKLDSEGSWVTIDSVFGVNNTSYIDITSNANNISESFKIRALDSCGNISASSLDHNSINLNASMNACSHTISMDWNDYINWIGGTHHYDVIINETTCGVDPRSSVRINSDVTDWIISDIIDGCTYDIHVLAYNSDSTYIAMSDQISFYADLPKKPDFNYITTSSVNHFDGSVDISCYVDNTAVISRYDIDRSEGNTNNFIYIGSVPFAVGTDIISYNDQDVRTSDYFYQYHVWPVDTCNQRVSAPIIPLSTVDTSLSQTILLNTDINTQYGSVMHPSEYTNTIYFNNYIEWLGDVSRYNLYRSVNREPFVLIPLHTFYPGDSLVYVDVVSDFVDGNGRFCYYIEAIEGEGNDLGFLERSFSNVSCVSQTPKLFIPNTFTPNDDDHNELFRPVNSFVSEIGYSFSIFNRSGDQIFLTNDPSKGWDGTFKGSKVPNGDYVYSIEYVNGVGEFIQQVSSVSLIR